ncbi:MAG: hypothetical protein ACOC7U_00610 [Spirochaetota bacterium]
MIVLKRSVLLLLIIFIPSVYVLAETKEKVLVYYFKNISEQETYSDLQYYIPVCLDHYLADKLPQKQVLVINREILRSYSEQELWESRFLLEMAKKEGISQIIWGEYYIEGQRPVIFPKIMFVKSGLVLGLSKEQDVYFSAVQQVEKMDIIKIRKCAESNNPAVLSPPERMLISRRQINPMYILSAYSGIIHPISGWKDIYSPGVYGEVSFSVLPKAELVPVGFGVDTGFIIMRSKQKEVFKVSEMLFFPIGGMFIFKTEKKGFFNGLVFKAALGLGVTKLVSGADSWMSTDLYSRVSGGVVLNPWGDFYMGFHAGYMSIQYKDLPVHAPFVKAGLWFSQIGAD